MRALLAAVALSLAAVASAASPEDSPQLRVMTYNIRLDIASDGPNAWAHRREWVAAQVLWLRPDIFGMQEVRPNQKSGLAADLSQYRLFGEGRDEKGAGEASPIGFDTKRFEFLEGGMFWLSPTPELSSKGWDAAYPRIATWVRLRVRGARQVILAINTHWDHVGLVAREQSAAQIARWIQGNARRCEYMLLIGDFNSADDSAQMQALLRGQPVLRDARAVTKSAPFGPAGTFNEFKTAPTDSKAIDHILLGERIEVERYAVISQVIDGRVPSDHFPVVADLTLARCR